MVDVANSMRRPRSAARRSGAWVSRCRASVLDALWEWSDRPRMLCTSQLIPTAAIGTGTRAKIEMRTTAGHLWEVRRDRERSRQSAGTRYRDRRCSTTAPWSHHVFATDDEALTGRAVWSKESEGCFPRLNQPGQPCIARADQGYSHQASRPLPRVEVVQRS